MHLTKLADGATSAPGGTGTFRSFGLSPLGGAYAGFVVIVRRGTAVFAASDMAGVGIWSVPATGGGIRLVANYKTVLPNGGSLSSSYSFGMTDNGAVVFSGFDTGTATDGYQLGASVYTARTDGSHLAVIADADHQFYMPGTNRNPGAPCVGNFESVAVAGDTVVFGGWGIEEAGTWSIYAQPVGSRPLGTSPINQKCELKGSAGPVVRNWRMPLPGYQGSPGTTDVFLTQTDGSKVYFQVCSSNGCNSAAGGWGGIFSVPLSRGAVTPIVKPGDRLPRIGRVTDVFPEASGEFSVDSGDVAFIAENQSVRPGTPLFGIFLLHQGKILKVFASGDKLDGQVAGPNQSIQVWPQALKNGRLAFEWNGGIFVASLNVTA